MPANLWAITYAWVSGKLQENAAEIVVSTQKPPVSCGYECACADISPRPSSVPMHINVPKRNDKGYIE